MIRTIFHDAANVTYHWKTQPEPYKMLQRVRINARKWWIKHPGTTHFVGFLDFCKVDKEFSPGYGHGNPMFFISY